MANQPMFRRPPVIAIFLVGSFGVMLFLSHTRRSYSFGKPTTADEIALRKLAQHGIIDYESQIADFVFQSKIERVETRPVLGGDGATKSVFIRVFYKSGEIESYAYHLYSDELVSVRVGFESP
jgi:hypothetical protein